jgi:hypothetical protein
LSRIVIGLLAKENAKAHATNHTYIFGSIETKERVLWMSVCDSKYLECMDNYVHIQPIPAAILAAVKPRVRIPSGTTSVSSFGSYRISLQDL